MIVTGFVDLSRFDGTRTRPAAEYLQRAVWLYESLAPVLCFSEQQAPGQSGTVINEPAEFSTADNREDMALAAQALRSGKQTIGWDPKKDTGAYLCLMRHKIEWMVRATTVLGAQHYAWLDFGYRNLPGDDVFDLIRRSPAPGKIRIAELSYVPRWARETREAFYRQHWYPLGGGVMVAAAPELLWLRERIAEEWDWALAHGYAVTDEMMIGFIRYQHPERFEIYYADHPTLLSNYLTTRSSHDLIRLMAERARQDGDDAECESRLLSIGKSWPPRGQNSASSTLQSGNRSQ